MDPMISRVSLLVFASVVLLGGSSAAVSSSLTGAAAPACVAQWRAVAKGSNVPLLHDVAALSEGNTWSVGEVKEGGRTVPVVVHWNGRRLSVKRVLAPSSPVGGTLRAISAAAPDDVWAVGSRAKNPASQREPVSPLVVRWDGRNWTSVPMPATLANVDFLAVKAFSTTDVWAVGTVGVWPTQHAAAVHWDGRTWRLWRLDGPASRLSGIDGPSSRDLWAVGGARMNAAQMAGQMPLALHWNGRSWQPAPALVPSVDPNGELYVIELAAIDARSTFGIWTLAFDYAGAGEWIAHGSGKLQVSYGVTRGALWDVAAVSSREAWAVGQDRFGRESRPLVAHWAGRSWKYESTALGNLTGTTLDALSVISATETWAVGDHLIARYSCPG
jgi:hypothetical protein